MSERFKFYGQFIVDDLTGHTYHHLQDICKLLNDVNDRADRNAEKYLTQLWKSEKCKTE